MPGGKWAAREAVMRAIDQACYVTRAGWVRRCVLYLKCVFLTLDRGLKCKPHVVLSSTKARKVVFCNFVFACIMYPRVSGWVEENAQVFESECEYRSEHMQQFLRPFHLPLRYSMRIFS
jgi:hypothetical protein